MAKRGTNTKPGPLPKRANVGVPNQPVTIDTQTYFLGTRMERAGMLNKGHAIMLAATLGAPQNRAKGAPNKRGSRK